MKRNHSKYHATTFGRVERNPLLTCEGTVIPSQDEMELLGVPIDNKLKFEQKICKISRKVSQQVAVLNRLKKILPFELRIDIYRAFIAPHFNYYSQSWHHHGKRGWAISIYTSSSKGKEVINSIQTEDRAEDIKNLDLCRRARARSKVVHRKLLFQFSDNAQG